MEKTKIDWCDSSWNPVTGCLHPCQYCYARNIANRFSGNLQTDNVFVELNDRVYNNDSKKAEAYPYGFNPTLHRYRLNEYVGKKGRNIFVCSMADLFGNWVPDYWIEEVFEACKSAPQHNYLFLTKNPNRYVELQEEGKLIVANNIWYGASVTTKDQLSVASDSFAQLNCNAKTFLSVEPLLEDITLSDDWGYCIEAHLADWVIVGAETGTRKDKVIPEKEWISSIILDCNKEKIPVFMKASLTDIWNDSLVQEFPVQLSNKET